ncbi:MAG: hypothetical protein MZV64_02555 [Ignavibacteriales bacterium]|nr:hypothetical protein [Ignavibacteriales bacterium]
MSSHPPPLGDPGDAIAARIYSLGLYDVGIQNDPCSYGYGSFFGGVNCNAVNPFFWFSGDPTIPYGWINKVRMDQRSMTNTGPFQLFKNEPVDIIVAYVVARGNSPLNSVEVTKFQQSYKAILSF